MFVEVALAGIAVALEHQEVSIVGDLPANRTYLFGIEKFWWRPLLLLLLAFATPHEAERSRFEAAAVKRILFNVCQIPKVIRNFCMKLQ